MNLSITQITHPGKRLQTIKQFIIKKKSKITCHDVSSTRLSKCLAIWQHILPVSIDNAHLLWNASILGTSALFVQYCIIGHLHSDRDNSRIIKWFDTQTKKSFIFEDLPNDLVNYVESFLTPWDEAKFRSCNRLFQFDWLKSDYCQSIYLNMMKIHNTNTDDIFRGWCYILGQKRLAYTILFDDRCINDTTLDILLDNFQLEMSPMLKLFSNKTIPSITEHLNVDVLGHICKFLNYNCYCYLSNVSAWFWKLLHDQNFRRHIYVFNEIKLTDKWYHGRSRLDLYNLAQIVHNNMDNLSYLTLLTNNPLVNVTLEHIFAYIGHSFILPEFEANNSHPNLKIVVCDRSKSMFNHGFNQLWYHNLSHFFLCNNKTPRHPMHVRCNKFVVVDSDIGVSNIVQLFIYNYCKIFICWGSTIWTDEFEDNTHMLVPAPNVLRDKHLIVIWCNDWLYLCNMQQYSFLTFCVQKLTLVTQWSDLTMSITNFLTLVINKEEFPSLTEVLFLIVIPKNSYLLDDAYKIFNHLWGWIKKHHKLLINHSSIISWKMGLMRYGSTKTGHLFNWSDIFAFETLDKYRTQWLKILNNKIISEKQSTQAFVVEWNYFTRQFL